MPMSQGPPVPPPLHPVTASVTSDPHSWELMGGGGGAEQRLRSKAARLKVRAGRDPGWLDCATVTTSRQGWNLRHREDMIYLARSSPPGPCCPLCHADWLSGSERPTPAMWVLGTWVASKASGRAREPLSLHSSSPASASEFCRTTPQHSGAQQGSCLPALKPTWGTPTQLGLEVGRARAVPSHNL